MARRRSWALQAFALLLSLPIHVFGYGTYHAQPGDTVDMPIDISNSNEGRLKHVRLEVEAPPSIRVDQRRSRLGPVNIAPRSKKQLFVGLTISTSAPIGPADVIVRTHIDTPNVVPDPDLSLQIFTFIIDGQATSSGTAAASASVRVDTVAPAAVGPLEWTRISTHTVRLSFNGSGDDRHEGKAHNYVVTLIGSHLKRNRALVVPATAGAGERENVLLDDMPIGRFDVSVIARDLAGNESSPSTGTIALDHLYSAGKATLLATQELSFDEIDARSPAAVAFMASVSREKLKLLGPLYRVTAEDPLVLEEATPLTVPLDRAALTEAGLGEAEASLYRLVGDAAHPDFRPETAQLDPAAGVFRAGIVQPGIYAVLGTPIPDELLRMLNQSRPAQ